MPLFRCLCNLPSRLMEQKWKVLCLALVIILSVICGIFVRVPSAFCKFMENSCVKYLDIVCGQKKGLFWMFFFRIVFLSFFAFIAFLCNKYPVLFPILSIFLFIKLYFFIVFLRYFLVINGIFGCILILFLILPTELIFDFTYLVSPFLCCCTLCDVLFFLGAGALCSCLWEFLFILLFFRIMA